jgi:hypothetical protein
MKSEQVRGPPGHWTGAMTNTSSRTARWVIALPASVLLWACTSHSLQAPEPAVESQAGKTFDASPSRKLDLLFMIDDSHSMGDEQKTLRDNFPVFMQALEGIVGGVPDLRVAVISSDVGAGGLENDTCKGRGDQGRFLVKEGCGLDPRTAHFLATDGRGHQNFTGELAKAFACLADLGTRGCGFEHQLQAIRAALSATNPENQGFLRPDAYLGIIMLTDEDDCSGEPDAGLFAADVPGTSSLRCATLGHVCGGREVPAGPFRAPLASCKPFQRTDDAAGKRDRLINVDEIVSYVKALKDDPAKIIVAGVIGWDDRPGAEYRLDLLPPNAAAGRDRTELDVASVCSDSDGYATPAVRLKAFIDAFGKNGSWHTICPRAGDLREVMKRIGEEFVKIIDPFCIDATLVDTDPGRPGLQPDCVVSDVRRASPQAPAKEATLRACASGAPPCWELTSDPEACGARPRLVVKRPAGQEPAPGTLLEVKCLACAGGPADDPRCRQGK